MTAPAFLTRLRVVRLEDRYGWALLQPLLYRSALGGVGELVIPAGFVTDFASVPRVPFAFLLAGDTAHAAAVVHDYCYRRRPTVGLPPRAITRRTADAVLFEAMVATGVPAWRRWLMWAAVRAAGWVTWGRARAGPADPISRG